VFIISSDSRQFSSSQVLSEYEDCSLLECGVIYVLCEPTFRKTLACYDAALYLRIICTSKTEETSSSQTFITKRTRRHIPEDGILHSHSRGTSNPTLCQTTFNFKGSKIRFMRSHFCRCVCFAREVCVTMASFPKSYSRRCSAVSVTDEAMQNWRHVNGGYIRHSIVRVCCQLVL
jgi:hypothetical protein